MIDQRWSSAVAPTTVRYAAPLRSKVSTGSHCRVNAPTTGSAPFALHVAPASAVRNVSTVAPVVAK